MITLSHHMLMGFCSSHITHMPNTFRFVTFKDAVVHLMDTCNLSNQEATHFIWDNQFTMGTDRAIWLTIPADLGC
jgi:hypothetical protein